MVRPSFTILEIETLIENEFNISGEIRTLPSYADQNFHIRLGNSKEYVLKIANSEEKFKSLSKYL